MIFLFYLRLHETFHRALHIVDSVIDDRVELDLYILCLGGSSPRSATDERRSRVMIAASAAAERLSIRFRYLSHTLVY
jgi:hypothetical protein